MKRMHFVEISALFVNSRPHFFSEILFSDLRIERKWKML